MIVSCFDIEATNLRADFGIPIGFVFKDYVVDPKTRGRPTPKFVGKRTVVDLTQTPDWDRRPDDRWLLRQFVKCWNNTSMVVSYNGWWYDVPFITSRLLRWNMKPLEPKIHLDLYRRIVKWNVLTSRRSLHRISGFFETHAKKDHMMEWGGDLWIRAAAMDKKAIRAIIKRHCVADVDTLEEVYHRTIPFIANIKRR